MRFFSLAFSIALKPLTRRAVWIASLALLTAGSLGVANPSLAAEEVVLTYGPLAASFPLEDLQTLARSGQPSQSLAFYLGIAGVDPAMAQQTLNMAVPLSQTFLDDLLNAPTGDRLLTRLTDVVHTPSREGSVPALRSAIVQAAGADQQITLLELMEHYPTQQMYINAANLMTLMNEISVAQRTER